MKKVIVIVMALALLFGVAMGPGPLEDWESLEELEQFLEADQTDATDNFTAGADGVIRFNEDRPSDKAICLAAAAEAQGKRLNVVPIGRDEAWRVFGWHVPPEQYMLVCSAQVEITGYTRIVYIVPWRDDVIAVARYKASLPENMWQRQWAAMGIR